MQQLFNYPRQFRSINTFTEQWHLAEGDIKDHINFPQKSEINFYHFLTIH